MHVNWKGPVGCVFMAVKRIEPDRRIALPRGAIRKESFFLFVLLLGAPLRYGMGS